MSGNDWEKDAIESVLERLKYLQESGHESDVEFLVGNEAMGIELIKAHKFVLGTISSSVFDAQFRANKANGLPLDEPIKVIDVEPSAFKAMLKFLYSNDLSGINEENIAAVLATAKKYLLPAFAKKCVGLAFELLDVENALGLLKVADLHDEKTLVEHCQTFIDKNIANNVETDEFLLLNQNEITKLFVRDTLQCDELILFQGLNRWAQKQCEDKNIVNPTGEQKRAVIGSALLNAIRFPLINPEDFAQQIDTIDLHSKFVRIQLFPAVTLFDKGDSIKANFGKKPWRYNPSQLIIMKNNRVECVEGNKWKTAKRCVEFFTKIEFLIQIALILLY